MRRVSRIPIAAIAVMLVIACQSERTTVEPSLRHTAEAVPNAGDAAPDPQVIVVNPNAHGNGVAATIQEGIDRVAAGGQVLVTPGTYGEALVITKGLTLRPIGEGAGPVVIDAGTANIGIQVATADPVAIQDITLLFSGANGIRGQGLMNVTVERVTARAIDQPLGTGAVISLANNVAVSGGRTRVTLRDNTVDGGVAFKDAPSPAFPQTFGIFIQGDIDALVEGNTVRRTGGACIFVSTLPNLGGESNVDILANDIDECYPLQGAGSLLVQPPGGVSGTVTATGVVNIIGNTIRNSLASPLPATAISQLFAPGRVERNRILGVVQPDAVPLPGTRLQAGIWIGSLSTTAIAPNIAPVIRFNDIQGNAFAGLRIGPNITATIDATCNWWGAPNGPSGLGSGSGDAVLKEGTGPAPSFTPFATSPVAATATNQCD